MRKLKKRLAALGVGLAVMATSVASLSASAWSKVDWPGFYTPAGGSFTASESRVQVTNMRWTSDQTTAFNPPLQPTPNTEQNGIEFEFRPCQNPHTVWAEKTSETSNFPLAYFEFQPSDDDDIAVCCGDLKYVVAGTTYYGTMGLKKQPSFTNSNLAYTFESEYGTWAGIASAIMQDYVPIFGAWYKDAQNNATFGHYYGW